MCRGGLGWFSRRYGLENGQERGRRRVRLHRHFTDHVDLGHFQWDFSLRGGGGGVRNDRLLTDRGAGQRPVHLDAGNL